MFSLKFHEVFGIYKIGGTGGNEEVGEIEPGKECSVAPSSAESAVAATTDND